MSCVLGIFKQSLSERSRKIEGVIERTTNLRHLFLNDEEIRTFPMKSSHSHPEAAAWRSSANAAMTRIVKRAGYEPYHVSCSTQDAGDGSRYFYGVKDLTIPYKDIELRENHALVMCDVDYYTNVNKWMRAFKPILLYTFTPVGPVGRTKDFTYRFIDNQVDFAVAGGSSYRHSLWQYENDTCSTVDKYGRLCTFYIERRKIEGDKYHSIVALIPATRTPAPYYWKMDMVAPIRRFEPMKAGTTVNVFYEPVDNQVHLSKNGGWVSVTVDGAVYEAIASRLRNKEAPPVVSDVERLLLANGSTSSKVDGPLLYEMLGGTLECNMIKTNGSISFTPVGKLVTEDGKVPGRAGSTPLVSQPALLATKSVNSDQACISGRVNKPRNLTVPPARYTILAEEFVQHIVKKPGVGVPLAIDEVRRAQAGPMQKARYKKAEPTLSLGYVNRLSAFIKAEAYAGANDPRNITTMVADNTILLSCFTMSFKDDNLKQHEWYGPGLTPRRTCKRLRVIADATEDTVCVDYTRLDGSVSEWLQRSIVLTAYERWCSPDYRAELMRHLKQVFVQRAVTATGEKYDPGYGTRSGSAITTDGNTMMCAFVVYCAYREIGYSPEDAIKRIGLVFGDDGAFSDDDGLAAQLPTVASELGLKIKIDIISRGDPIPYLGRYFVDPRTTFDSFQDPKRTIAKLHITTNCSVSVEQAMANKAAGYLVTDGKTPIIGAYARAVMRITKLKPKAMTGEEKYKASNAWPQKDWELIAETMAKVCDLEVNELKVFDRETEKVTALDEFKVLFTNERANKICAVIGAEVVHVAGNHIKDKTLCDCDESNEQTAATSQLPSVDNHGEKLGINAGTSAPREARQVCGQVPRPGHAFRGSGCGCGHGPRRGTGQGSQRQHDGRQYYKHTHPQHRGKGHASYAGKRQQSRADYQDRLPRRGGTNGAHSAKAERSDRRPAAVNAAGST
jgi:hypothetical protein